MKAHAPRRPTHDPPHRKSLQPGADFATSRTRSSLTKNARQLFGQEIPLGALVTVPCPVIVTKTTRPTGPGNEERPVEANVDATPEITARTSSNRAIFTSRTIAPGQAGRIRLGIRTRSELMLARGCHLLAARSVDLTRSQGRRIVNGRRPKRLCDAPLRNANVLLTGTFHSYGILQAGACNTLLG